jgi:hypothetical protein
MLCRSILVNIAREEGAPDGQPFDYYLSYLASEGLVPRKARQWIDRVRSSPQSDSPGRIPSVSRQNATDLLTFVEYMLRFNYEFPSRAPDTEPGNRKLPT